MRATVGRNPVCTSLPFNVDALVEVARRTLTRAFRNTFHAAKLWIFLESRLMASLRLNDEVPDSAASFCIYWFTCFCGTICIGRTIKRFSERILERHSEWLRTRTIASPNGAVVLNLAQANNIVNVNAARKLSTHVKVQSRFDRRRALWYHSSPITLHSRKVYAWEVGRLPSHSAANWPKLHRHRS